MARTTEVVIDELINRAIAADFAGRSIDPRQNDVTARSATGVCSTKRCDCLDQVRIMPPPESAFLGVK
jgi:hypothetical protein